MTRLRDGMEHERRIEKAEREHDAETLAYYRQFLNPVIPYTGAASMAENACAFEHYRACGFMGGFAEHLNKYGWFEYEVKPTETVSIYDKHGNRAFVHLALLPNGRWVSGIDVQFSGCGFMDGVHIYGRQYKTRLEALRSQLKRIVCYAERNQAAATVNAIKRRITEAWGRGQPVQLELFGGTP